MCRVYLTIEGKDYVFDDLRATVVALEEEGIFKIFHMHASFPDHRNPEAGSFPID